MEITAEDISIALAKKKKRVSFADAYMEPEEEEEPTKLDFIKHPDDVIASNLGESLELKCEFIGTFESLKWYKEEVEMFEMRNRYEIHTEEGISVLKILRVAPQDIGKYYVTLNDTINSHSCQVDIRAQPKIDLQGTKTEIRLNSNQHLNTSLEFSGYPKPEINVTLNGNSFKIRGSVEVYEDTVTLKIRNLKPSDSGIIEIEAANKNGTTKVTLKLVVIDVPSAPQRPMCTKVTHKSAEITWNAPADDNGAPVTAYVIERKTVEFSRWRQVSTIDDGSTKYIAKDLLSNEFYGFRILAVNACGESAPSKVVDVDTLSEPEHDEDSIDEEIREKIEEAEDYEISEIDEDFNLQMAKETQLIEEVQDESITKKLRLPGGGMFEKFFQSFIRRTVSGDGGEGKGVKQDDAESAATTKRETFKTNKKLSTEKQLTKNLHVKGAEGLAASALTEVTADAEFTGDEHEGASQRSITQKEKSRLSRRTLGSTDRRTTIESEFSQTEESEAIEAGAAARSRAKVSKKSREPRERRSSVDSELSKAEDLAGAEVTRKGDEKSKASKKAREPTHKLTKIDSHLARDEDDEEAGMLGESEEKLAVGKKMKESSKSKTKSETALSKDEDSLSAETSLTTAEALKARRKAKGSTLRESSADSDFRREGEEETTSTSKADKSKIKTKKRVKEPTKREAVMDASLVGEEDEFGADGELLDNKMTASRKAKQPKTSKTALSQGLTREDEEAAAEKELGKVNRGKGTSYRESSVDSEFARESEHAGMSKEELAKAKASAKRKTKEASKRGAKLDANLDKQAETGDAEGGKRLSRKDQDSYGETSISSEIARDEQTLEADHGMTSKTRTAAKKGVKQPKKSKISLNEEFENMGQEGDAVGSQKLHRKGKGASYRESSLDSQFSKDGESASAEKLGKEKERSSVKKRSKEPRDSKTDMSAEFGRDGENASAKGNEKLSSKERSSYRESSVDSEFSREDLVGEANSDRAAKAKAAAKKRAKEAGESKAGLSKDLRLDEEIADAEMEIAGKNLKKISKKTREPLKGKVSVEADLLRDSEAEETEDLSEISERTKLARKMKESAKTNAKISQDFEKDEDSEGVTDSRTHQEKLKSKKKLREPTDAEASVDESVSRNEEAENAEKRDEGKKFTFGQEMAPEFVKKQRDITAEIGSTAVIDVKVAANPEPLISVYKDNEHMEKSERVTFAVTQEGNLYSFSMIIENVRPMDAGMITMIISNDFGKAEHSFKFKVEKSAPRDLMNFEAPQFVSPIKDQVIMEGETARLKGKVLGYPSPELIWLKNGKELQVAEDSRFTLEYAGDGEIDLSISNCTFADDDEYSLLVENIAGVDSCNFELIVECPVYDDAERFERRRINRKTRKMQRQEAVAPSSDSEIDLEKQIKKKGKRTKKVFERSNSLAKRMTQLLPPKFDKILSDHDAVEGENVILSVEARGIPEPEIHFYQDGKKLKTDDKVLIKRGSGEAGSHMLILKDIQKDEEAEYACQAVNIAGEAWCFSDVVVRSSKEDSLGADETIAGKEAIPTNEIHSRFGDPSTLHSETNITTKITAKEGSAEVLSPLKQPLSASIVKTVRSRTSTPVDGAEQSTDEEGVSVTSKSTERDQATMHALATERRESVDRKAEAEGQLDDSLTKRRLSTGSTDSSGRRRKRREGFVSVPDSRILALRGDSIKFECELANEEDEMEWFINGKPVKDEPKATIVNKGIIRHLILSNVSPKDSNIVISGQISSAVFESKLIVEETPVIIESKLARKTICKEGEPFTIKVKLNHGTKSVRWLKDNEDLNANFDYELFAEPDDEYVSLTIKNPSYKHAGRYTLQAGDSEVSTVLEIHGKPIFPEEGRPIEIESQENLVMNLIFKGEPEPTAEITLNGKPIPKEAKAELGILSNTIRFSKRHASKEDSGEYKITIKNEYGEASTTVKVTVADVPFAPSDVSIANLSGNVVTLEWAPSNDGGAQITGYIVEKKEYGRRAFHSVGQVSSTRTAMEIEELEADSEYVFRVAAMNKFGTGEFAESKPVKTGTAFEAPSITEPPRIGAITNDSISISWSEPTRTGGSPIYAYEVFVKENGSGWTKVTSEPIFVKNYTVTDLKPGVDYKLKVEALNEAGLQSSSDKSTEFVSVQGKPAHKLQIPKVIITDADSVDVYWDSPSDSEPTEYTVAYRSEQSSVWAEVNVPCSPAHITDLKEGIAYVFRVAPRNQHGVGEYSDTTTPVKVALSVAPTIIKALKDVTVPQPAPEYIWYKDRNEFIPKDDTMEILCEGHMSALKIHGTSADDGGKYTCEVINEIGKAQTSANVTIGDVRAHFERSFSEETSVEEGMDIVLTCTLSDADATVNWFKDGRKLAVSERIEINKTGPNWTLRVKKATLMDAGHYRCETSDERSRAEGNVIVKEEDPHIQVGPQDQFVQGFGETVTLTCELTKPVRKPKWFKNGVEVWPQMSKIVMSMEDKTATLMIRNFEKNDVGEYTISISDKEKSAPAKVVLNVKPIITIPEPLDKPEVIAIAGKEFDFAAEFKANPEPSIKIYHNGQPISLSGAEIDKYEDTVSVRMKHIKKGDSGEIKIVASNEHGETVKTINLNVIDVPSEPLNVVPFNTTTHSTCLSWEAPESNNGSPITGYVIERRQVEHDRWRNVGRARPNHLTFEDLELFNNDLYTYRVLAVNEVGPGHPSKHVDVYTLEDEREESEERETVVAPTQELETPEVPDVVVDRAEVHLTWPSTPSAEFYRIERKPATTGAWIELATTDRLNYTDRSITDDEPFVYRLVALGSNTISPAGDASVAVKIPKEKLEKLKPESKKQEEEEERLAEMEQRVEEEESGKKRRLKKKEKKSPSEAKVEKRSLSFEDGQDAELFVQINDQEVEAEWTKDGQSLDVSFKVITEKNSCRLQFKANEKTGGKYVCKVKTKDGQSAIVDFEVVINEKPRIEIEESSMDVKAGETVQLYANISGHPPPICTWTKDGKALKNDSKHTMKEKDGVATLTIKNCQPESAGTYVLLAKNKTGETIVKIKLGVKGLPSAPEGPVEVTTVTAEGCTLSWNPPQNDGGSPILGYCVERREAKKNTWAFVTRTTETSTMLTGMQWDVDYLFRISAENAMGAGPPVETSATIKLPKKSEKPLMAPPKPQVIGVTQNSAKVEWKASEDPKTHYLLEFKEVKSKRSWQTVTKETITTTTHTAEGLKKDIEYQFRVSYVNETGSGPASEPSDPVKCEDRKVEAKPEFTVKPDELVVGKEKGKVKMVVEFNGEPQPEVHWLKNKKEVFSGKRQWIETSPGTSSLTIGEMREDDEGEITIKLKNSLGEASYSFKLCMDSPPQINRVERYASAQLFDKGETVKLRLSFTGLSLFH
ncbi:unnamed protein product, partial [Mesorhabditis belari]|uniref:Uncharacterized protein n=1 Tax=Mesorhabditis belari TaxID=2138241 RepID=A0AAF3J413_9BILA